jgi:hypothetical protein
LRAVDTESQDALFQCFQHRSILCPLSRGYIPAPGR